MTHKPKVRHYPAEGKQEVSRTVPHSAASYLRLPEYQVATPTTPSGTYRNMRHDAALRHCAALEMMAERLVRLSPSSRDPERFHVEKHTLAAEIRFLADQIRRHAA